MTTINCDCDDDHGTRTLADLRRSIIVLAGWAAVADNPPPGVAEFVNEQLRLAHSLLWRRFPALRLRRWFTWNLGEGERFYDLNANAERAGLGTPPAPTLEASVSGGTLATATYTYRIARATDDGTTLPSAAATVDVTGPTGSVTLTLPAAVPGQQYWIIYGRSGTVIALDGLDATETTWVDVGLETSGSGVETVDSTITCDKAFDPYGIVEAWYERDEQRTKLIRGLPSSELARTIDGWPSHFDVRQCLEIWPAPSATEGCLRILSRYQTTAFDEDDHIPGVPDDMVMLLALAQTKRHYNKPDAGDYIQQMEVLLADLTAGTHGGRTYIPGEREASSGWVEPRPTVPFP